MVKVPLPSIDREVDDDLLELTLVNLDRAKVAPVHNFELDILADQTPQQVRQIDQHIGDIENPWLQCLLPREGQQLSHQIGGSVGVLLNLHDVGKGRVTRLKAQQQEVAEPDHGGQQIVEVMRHPAGELTDGLHLLRLGELDLQVLLLGNVDKMEGEPTAPIDPGDRSVSLDVVDPAEE